MAASPGSQSQSTGLECLTSWYLFPPTVDKRTMSYDYNPLILPSTSHTRDLGHAKLQPRVPGGRPASTCLRIWFSGCCHASTCLGIHQSRDHKLTCLNLPRDSICRRWSHFNMPGDLHPDLGMPGSQVATVVGRIKLQKDSPLRKSTDGSKRKPVTCEDCARSQQ